MTSRASGARMGGLDLEPRSFSEHGVIEEHFRRRGRKGRMFDIGAFDGRSFAPFLDLGWEVYAFEPNPIYYETLVRTFDSPRLVPCNWAISNESAPDQPFYATEEAVAVASLHPFLSSHQEVARITVKTLREVMAEGRIEQVDYLKVDAEGFDLPVLQGFPWEVVRPGVVMCEFENFKTRQLGYDTHDLGGFLLDRGYQVFLSEWHPIVRYGGPHRWRAVRAYPCELMEENAWGNFIAVAGDDADAMIGSILDGVATDREKHVFEAGRREDSLRRTREALGQRNEMIQNLRTALARRDEAIQKLRAHLDPRAETPAREDQATAGAGGGPDDDAKRPPGGSE